MFLAYGKEKGSNISRLKAWEKIEQRTGKWVGEPKPVKPTKVMYLWEEFLLICKGCEEVDYNSISSYIGLTGAVMTPWEIDLIIGIGLARTEQCQKN